MLEQHDQGFSGILDPGGKHLCRAKCPPRIFPRFFWQFGSFGKSSKQRYSRSRGTIPNNFYRTNGPTKYAEDFWIKRHFSLLMSGTIVWRFF